MRDPENIRALLHLDIDYMGLIFYPKSPRCVKHMQKDVNISSFIADMSDHKALGKVKLTGVFVDEVPQKVVADTITFRLDCIQLHGNETPAYIDSLRRLLDILSLSQITIIKAIGVRDGDDLQRWKRYKNRADMLLFDTKCDSRGGSGTKFDWSVVGNYDGDIPFLLSGGIGPADAEVVTSFSHPLCEGIDINSRFETSPGVKDIPMIETFIGQTKHFRKI